MKGINFTLGQIPLSKKIKVFGQVKTFALPIITVIVFLFVLFLVQPRISSILELSESVKVLEQQTKVLEEKIGSLGQIDGQDLRSKIQQAEKALPSEKDVPSLLFSVDKLATDTGVSVTSLQLTPGEITATTSASQSFDKLPIRLSIGGSYEGVRDFLTKSVSSNRIFKILKVSLTTGQGQASISASLDLEVYFLPLTNVRFKIEDPLPKMTPEEEKAIERALAQPDLFTPSETRPSTSGRINPFSRF